ANGSRRGLLFIPRLSTLGIRGHFLTQRTVVIGEYISDLVPTTRVECNPPLVLSHSITPNFPCRPSTGYVSRTNRGLTLSLKDLFVHQDRCQSVRRFYR